MRAMAILNGGSGMKWTSELLLLLRFYILISIISAGYRSSPETSAIPLPPPVLLALPSASASFCFAIRWQSIMFVHLLTVLISVCLLTTWCIAFCFAPEVMTTSPQGATGDGLPCFSVPLNEAWFNTSYSRLKFLYQTKKTGERWTYTWNFANHIYLVVVRVQWKPANKIVLGIAAPEGMGERLCGCFFNQHLRLSFYIQ